MSCKRTLRWSIPICWFILIIFLSTQSGEDSGKLSLWIAEHLIGDVPPESVHIFIRNAAHFGTHFVLAALTYIAAKPDLKKPPLFCLVACSIVAICDETIQCLIPGRYLELTDISLNLLGIIAAILSCVIVDKRT